MRSIKAVAVMIATIASVVAWRSPHIVARTFTSACAPSSDRHASALLEQMRVIVSDPRLASRRAEYQLPTIDPQRVQPVRSDSLCRRASYPINRELGDPDSTSLRLYMLSIGNVYWAEDTTRMGGEFMHAFVLDSTLTRVILHTSR